MANEYIGNAVGKYMRTWRCPSGTRDMVIKCCKKAGLKVEKFEIRKGMRMHCVVRKPMGKAIGNER